VFRSCVDGQVRNTTSGAFDDIVLTRIVAVLIASLSPAVPAQDSKGARETTMRVPPTNDKR
jgi:hypothetical protein